MTARRLVGIVLTCVAVLAVSSLAVTRAGADRTVTADGDAIIRTDAGRVRGRATSGHVTYAGIPYAAPPVGEGRWAPPRPAARWEGVRDATSPASPCPQSDQASDPPTVVGDEDCLYLNVTTPRRTGSGARGPGRGARLPVMVWFHGGGFVDGAGSQYDGALLAETGDVVVVTVNYRLGALGYLSSPALDRGGQPSGNYGLQDQQAALRWVARNASRFGGDPGNVTVFGQSAGAASVCALLAAPGTDGLFHKAITQSGACANPLVTKPVADQRGQVATAQLGCAAVADVAACLRGRPVDAVLATAPTGPPSLMGPSSSRPWLPVVGTAVLPHQPLDALASGAAAGIPLLVGNLRDEMRPLVGFRYDAVGNPLTVPRYQALIAETFGPEGPAVLARYPAAAYPSAAVALATVLTDWGANIGACPVLRTAQVAAQHAPVYAYELAEDSDQVFGGFPMGAYHGWDLPFLWGAVAIPGSAYPDLTAEQQDLSRRMVAYWTDFARTGSPNARGSVPWPRLRPGSDTVLSLAAGDGGIAPVPFARRHNCDLWS